MVLLFAGERKKTSYSSGRKENPLQGCGSKQDFLHTGWWREGGLDIRRKENLLEVGRRQGTC